MATETPNRAVDPDIARFNAALTQAWREHPPLDTLSLAEARAVAEIVRAPLRRGGPVMARTEDIRLTLAAAPMRLRIHYPSLAPSLPALIYLHGGGFTLFSIDTHDRLMREYAAAGGFAVIGIDYPLSPEAKYPLALDGIVALAGWLAGEGPALGIDPGRLAIGGDSAGGNLSVAACLRWRDQDGAMPVRGMLLNYGAFTGRCSDEAEAELGGPDAVLCSAEMDWFYANYLADPSGLDDPLACPILADLHDLPPAMLAVADRDLLAEQSFTMAEHFAAARVPCNTRIYPGATHSFLEAMATAPLAMQAIRDGAAWVAAHLAA
ncbi:MAG: alpha/beta hydrolase [Novosphingobium sp.]|nr:alpha/beta hydrolase [Novosphingobium sp.]